MSTSAALWTGLDRHELPNFRIGDMFILKESKSDGAELGSL